MATLAPPVSPPNGSSERSAGADKTPSASFHAGPTGQGLLDADGQQAVGRDQYASPTPRTGVPRGLRPRWTMETALYGLLLLAAAVTRFWDLGSRTLHHDESLHAYYSWLFASGDGYVHDPLMHGPFLFHANALVYLLFGASDTTSRIMPALFGTVLVGLPWFLRGPRHLGRWGALAASVMLLVSPSLLYQSRYIRHDIYTVVGALVLCIGIVRYVERPERRWLVVVGGSLGFLLTNHEIVFGIAAIFVAVLWGALLWDRLRYLLPLHASFAVLLAGLWIARPGPLGAALPEIPWSRDGSESPPPTRENQLNFYWELLTHPLVISVAVLAAVAVAIGFLLLIRRTTDARASRLFSGLLSLGVAVAAGWAAIVALVDQHGQTVIGGWQPLAQAGAWRFAIAGALVAVGTVIGGRGVAAIRAAVDGDEVAAASLGDAPTGSVPNALLRALRDPAGVATAFAAGAVIFVVLYSSLFSNVEGLVTATIATDGTLNYWLGQHGYRRGDQPWFYYLLLMPQYEFLAVVFGVPAAIGVGASMIRAVLRGGSDGPRFFFRVFVAAWFVGILAALSWAGEKMPWLIVHITLPAILLGAGSIGALIERWSVNRSRRMVEDGRSARTASSSDALPRAWGTGETAVLAALLIAGGSWFFLAGRLSYGAFAEGSEPGGWTRAVTVGAADRWWWLLVPPAAALALVGIVWLAVGPKRSGRAALAATLVALVLLQVHGAWRTTYLEGDVPKDMLIYTQTSPDVSRMVGEIDALSAELTGGKGMEVWYDSGVSWPLQWYLRDFPNRQLRNGPLGGPPDDVPVVIVTNDRVGTMEPFLGDYTAQEYVLRWWFPESIYRDFAIAPELAPGRSAWDGSEAQRNPLAIARSVLDSAGSLLRTEGQQDLYRLLMYRDLPTPIGVEGGTFRYTVFVRDDLIPLLDTIRY